MKLIRKIRSLIIVLLLIFLIFTNVYAADKSYSCDKLNINITLLDDGSALFEEYWTMSYEGGNFTKFTRNIPLDSNYSISDFKVSENNMEYKRLDRFDSNKPVNSYAIEKSNNMLNLEIYYNAKNESRTFKMSYILNNAVVIHDDIAEFYWKVIGDEWQIPLNNVSVNINLPTGASREEIRAWAHGPLTGLVSIESSELVTLTVDKVNKNTYVEARIAAPKDLFKNSTNYKSGNALSNILAEEQRFADNANNERESMKKNIVTFYILPILLLIALAIYIIGISNRASQRYLATFKPKYYRELSKSGLTPSEVIDLIGFYKPTYGYDERFTSTLLDLSLKGFVSLKKDESLRKNNLIIKINYGKNTSDLKPHERKMIAFINEIANGNFEITQKEIKKYIDKHSSSVITTFNEFIKESNEEIKKIGYIDSSLKKYTKNYVIGMVSFIILAAIFALLQQYVLAACMFILFFIVMFCLIGCKRLTQLGEDELALWEGYKNFLKDFTSFNEKELPDLILWEKYIVYAVAVGMGKKILKELPMMYPQLNDVNYYTNKNMFNLYMMYNISNGKASFNDNMFDSINSFGDNIKSAFSASSSGSGAGGGFSSGGGGGGGGGGGCS